jgi:hypothetical protein
MDREWIERNKKPYELDIKNHALRIEEDSYKTAFAGRIPRDFVDAIQSKLFKYPFVRKGMRLLIRRPRMRNGF